MAQISSKLVGITKNLQKSSSDIFKTTKLSINLANEEEHLRNIYLEIGKKVHEIYTYGGTLGGVFDAKYAELRAAEEKIAEIKAMLESVKGTRECPNCKKSVSLSFEFCPKCGARMGPVSDEITATIPEIMEKPQAPEVNEIPKISEAPVQSYDEAPNPAKVVCPVCGLLNESGTKFCYSCGRFL